MRPPTPIVWKEIAKDESGRLYDVDQDFKASLYKPEITRVESGRIQRVTWDQNRLRPIARSLESKGHDLRFEGGELVSIDVRQHELTQPIDADVKRLCVKMSIAVWKRVDLVPLLDSAVRGYLVDGAVPAVCPVRIALDRYEALDIARPPVGHLVYCRMSGAERRFYSVVQFFGAMQFYCELASEVVGDDCAVLAVHDPITHSESFQFVSSIDYPLPPRFVDSSAYTDGWRERLERFRLELVSLYGDQAPLALSINPTMA
jgi:hypothetical protein